ncbi:MAG TPA: amino acid adenylation domain-containing protein [Candidatus Deferrimicrobium sp.]|nr:amino acid adenylation domain-containing protein [Candidatus Deferrimicrobium sp.]
MGNIDSRISGISFLTEQEKKHLLVYFNDNKEGPPGVKTIVHLIEEQAEQSSENTCLCCLDEQITYRLLNEKSNQLSNVLRQKGIIPGTIIGIKLERSIEMVIGILGILKAGGAYMPIDPGYPEERIDYMLKDSNAKIIINKSEIRNPKFETNPNKTNSNDQNKNLGAASVLNFEHLDLNSLTGCPRRGLSNFDIRASNFNSSNLAYVIYTSGSTGRPKGVVVEHIGMLNHIMAKTQDLQLSQESIIAQNASHTFDISVWQFFTALTLGGKTIIYPDELVFDPDRFIASLIHDRVTILEIVPSYLSVMLEFFDLNNRKFQSLCFLVVTGEIVLPRLVKRWFEKYPGIKMVNAYGPTEASDDITHFLMDKAPEGDRVSIGRPIRNFNIYIVDKNMNLCPVGVKGEIWVSGIGVGRGYLNNVFKTSRAFLRDPFVKEEVRLYKTGDLGRWRMDGTIEFFGREDYQVKIRGFRIELGEIESRLSSFPVIKDAVVIVQEDAGLCAFFTAREKCDIQALRNYLTERLPDYMTPDRYVELKDLPLMPNGKIDRKALSRLDVDIYRVQEYFAPRDGMEEKLVEIWANVLGIEKNIIGIDSNFFELGGHSLRATIMVARIYKVLNIKVPLVELFKKPTIRGFAEVLKELTREEYASIEPAEEKEYYSLSSAQKRLYILQQIESYSTAYNLPMLLTLTGAIDVTQLTGVFLKLINRHESLRTSFHMLNEAPVQKIHKAVEFKIENYDCEKVIQESPLPIITDFVKVFNLSAAPLLRVGFIKTNENEYILMIDMHHIITDGTSQALLTKEFMSIYTGQILPPLKLHYKDYSEWQQDQVKHELFKRQESFWLKQFEEEIPVLVLPTDYQRPNVQSFEGRSKHFHIDDSETGALKDLALKEGATLFMVLLSLFNVLLAKLSNQEDIPVGTPIAGRRHADLEDVIGMFVNTLVLRAQPFGESSFREFLHQLKKITLEAFENQDYPFEELVEHVQINRDVSRNPLFDVLFVLQNMGANPNAERVAGEELKGLQMSTFAYENKTSKFDLTLSAMEGEERLIFRLEYCTRLFKESTIERFINYFKRIASDVIANPAQKIFAVEIITEEERRKILNEFNDTEREYPGNKTIHQLFEEQVEKSPDHIALVGAVQLEEKKRRREEEKNGGVETLRATSLHIQMSYHLLNKQSDQLAGLLSEKGVLADTIVGIMVERSIEMIIGILGILKSGGAYLPIDPNYPQERIDYMLKDSNAKVLIINKSEIRNPKFETNPNDLNTNDQNKNQNPGAVSVLNFEHLNFEFVSCFEFRASDLNFSNFAYVMYTSGSTGQPKGVLVTHYNVVRLVKNTNFVPLNKGTRILQTGAPVFDATTFEIWGSLLNGGQLVLVDKESILDDLLLVKVLRNYKVNTLWLSAPLFNQLMQKNIELFAPLNYLIVGGDVLSPDHINRVKRQFPYLKIINGYGPTENTTFSTTYLIENEFEQNIPIGRPIANSTAYIYDKNSRLAPIGVTGELYVGGDGVARGYLNQPELTAEKFGPQITLITKINKVQKTKINKSFAGVKGELFQKPPLVFYKTGDQARWLDDGSIEFLGRIDNQVKIRGFRIELAEIEKCLNAHSAVKEAVVLDRQDENGDRYLCAYFTTHLSTGVPALSGLKTYLAGVLPEYMVPQVFVPLASIPLTLTGKIDKKSLPHPGISRLKSNDPYEEPGTEMEKLVAGIWSEVLKVDRIGREDNFFNLGGNSFSVIRVAARLQEVLKKDVPVVMLYKHLTVKSYASYLQSREDGISGPVIKKDRSKSIERSRHSKTIQKDIRKKR